MRQGSTVHVKEAAEREFQKGAESFDSSPVAKALILPSDDFTGLLRIQERGEFSFHS